MKRKIGLAILYFVVGWVSYLFFLYLTFPSDVARERVVYEANKAGIRLQLVSLKPSFPMGATLEGVDLYGFAEKGGAARKGRARPNRAVPGAGDELPELPEGMSDGSPGMVAGKADVMAEPEEAAPDEVPLLTLDSVRIPSLMPLIGVGKKSISGLSLEAELYGGELEGSYSLEGGTKHIVMDVRDINLSQYPFKGESHDLKVGGLFSMKTDLSIAEKVRDSQGSMSMAMSGLVVHKGSKIKGFDIPMELPFAVTGGGADVKNGRAELKELVLESPPLTVKVTGSITLNADPARSRFNLKVALKFGEELKLISAFLPENARSDDGFYHYIISGPFSNLRTRPDRLAARRRDTARPPGSETALPERPRADMPGPGIVPPTMPNIPSPGGPSDAPPSVRPPILDDAERERLREERRKRAEERRKRREELRQQRMRELGEDGAPPGGRFEGDPGDGGEDAIRRFPRVVDPQDIPGGEPDQPEEPQPWDAND